MLEEWLCPVEPCQIPPLSQGCRRHHADCWFPFSRTTRAARNHCMRDGVVLCMVAVRGNTQTAGRTAAPLQMVCDINDTRDSCVIDRRDPCSCMARERALRRTCTARSCPLSATFACLPWPTHARQRTTLGQRARRSTSSAGLAPRGPILAAMSRCTWNVTFHLFRRRARDRGRDSQHGKRTFCCVGTFLHLSASPEVA